MSEEVKSVHREPHPFVGIQHIQHFTGRTVAFVGKVDRVEDGTLYMKTADGKSRFCESEILLTKLRYFVINYLFLKIDQLKEITGFFQLSIEWY